MLHDSEKSRLIVSIHCDILFPPIVVFQILGRHFRFVPWSLDGLGTSASHRYIACVALTLSSGCHKTQKNSSPPLDYWYSNECSLEILPLVPADSMQCFNSMDHASGESRQQSASGDGASPGAFSGQPPLTMVPLERELSQDQMQGGCRGLDDRSRNEERGRSR